MEDLCYGVEILTRALEVGRVTVRLCEGALILHATEIPGLCLGRLPQQGLHRNNRIVARYRDAIANDSPRMY